MSHKLKFRIGFTRFLGISIFVLVTLLSGLSAIAQSTAQCTAKVFVEGPIASNGGNGAGIAIDAQDNLYIANNLGQRNSYPILGPVVFKVTPQGIISLAVPPGILGDVTDLAVDSQGNLYVADGNGNRGMPVEKNMIWKVDSSGSITPFITGINNPTGLAFDSAQNLYVSSFDDYSVYKYSSAGVFLGVVTQNLPDAPYDVAVDSSGNVFVTGFGEGPRDDNWGTQIFKVTPDGQRSVFVDPGFPDPYALVFDNQGYLYASYYNSLKILRIAPDGSYTIFPGGCVGDDAANGLAIDRNGILYAVVNGERTTRPQAVVKLYGVVPGSSSDSTFPKLNVPGSMLLGSDSSSGRIVSYTASAVDQLFNPALVTCNIQSGSFFPIGSTPVTCIANDNLGNTSAPQTFTVNIVDAPPVLTLPESFSTEATSSAGAEITYGVSAYDEVDGPTSVICNRISGDLFPVGENVVFCTTTDSANNTSTGAFTIFVLGPDDEETPVGQHVFVQPRAELGITFDNVTVPGITTVVPIDGATIGTIPSGFAVSNIAYQITTTSNFNQNGAGAVLMFVVPFADENHDGLFDMTPGEFNSLIVLHNHNGTLEALPDYGRDYDSRTLHTYTYSFSPFYLARRVNTTISPTFNQSTAYQHSSNVPIRLKVLDGKGANISSTSLGLTARSVVRLSGNINAPAVSPGASNADNNFSFVSGEYKYNLKTTGLAPGRYVLSFYAGTDRASFYTVEFQLK